MEELLSPKRLCKVLRDKISGCPEPLFVYWLEIKGHRDEYVRQFRQLSPENLICLVVRGALFDNPHSIFDDLVSLIERNRSSFPERLAPPSKQIALVLLARSPLRISQSASPVTMPKWFPLIGGEITLCCIEDLANTAEGPLASPEANVSEICADLLSFEAALLRRLDVCHEADHTAGNALFELFRDEKTVKYGAFLAGAISRNRNIDDRSGYRPSARDKISLIGCLLSVVATTPPEGISKVARHLAAALRLSLLDSLPSNPKQIDLSITTVLLRSTNPEQHSAIIAAKNMLMTIYAACQFITASHHSPEYPNLPIIVLRTTSFDIRRSLRRMTELLDGKTQPTDPFG